MYVKVTLISNRTFELDILPELNQIDRIEIHGRSIVNSSRIFLRMPNK